MITVTVTQDHIDKGERENGDYCPISLALNEQYPAEPGAAKWWVGDDCAVRLHNASTYTLPGDAQEFIHEYDDGQPVQPFVFVLAPTLD